MKTNSEKSIQWWTADLDDYGNPSLKDGPHEDRTGCEQALYLSQKLGLAQRGAKAICRVEIYEEIAKPHGANEEAISLLRREIR